MFVKLNTSLKYIYFYNAKTVEYCLLDKNIYTV